MAPRVTQTDAGFPAFQRRHGARKEQGVFDLAAVFVVAARETEQERGPQFVLDGGAKEMSIEGRRLGREAAVAAQHPAFPQRQVERALIDETQLAIARLRE